MQESESGVVSVRYVHSLQIGRSIHVGCLKWKQQDLALFKALAPPKLSLQTFEDVQQAVHMPVSLLRIHWIASVYWPFAFCQLK